MDRFYSTLYLDWKADRQHVAAKLADLADGTADGHGHVLAPPHDLDLETNDEYQPSSADFLFYRYLVEVGSGADATEPQHIELLCTLMRGLYEAGASVVAASDFEPQLTGRGKLLQSRVHVVEQVLREGSSGAMDRVFSSQTTSFGKLSFHLSCRIPTHGTWLKFALSSEVRDHPWWDVLRIALAEMANGAQWSLAAGRDGWEVVHVDLTESRRAELRALLDAAPSEPLKAIRALRMLHEQLKKPTLPAVQLRILRPVSHVT